MNYQQLKKELIISMRGSLTQQELSGMLGYSFNQVGKWESEQKILKWSEFCDICRVLDFSLAKAFNDVFLFVFNDPKDSTDLLDSLLGFYNFESVELMAHKIQCHPSVLRRWKRGQTSPDLESILKIIGTRTELLIQFLNYFTALDKLSSVGKLVQVYETQDITYTNPELSLVLLAIGLVEYKELPHHSDEFISEKIGIDIFKIKIIINKLLANGEIKPDKDKYTRGTFNRKNNDPVLVAKMKKYLVEKSLQRFNTDTGVAPNQFLRPNYHSYHLCSVSKEGSKKIAKKLHQCFEEIQQIISNDQLPETEIRIILLDCFSPDDVPKITDM